MTKDMIEKKIRTLCISKFGREFLQKDISLLSYHFSPAYLIVLFMELEKLFGIIFSEEFILERGILDINKTIDYIYSEINSA